MTTETIDSVRRSYARQLVSAVGGDDRLERAIANVPRENFLGPGPWQLFNLATGGYVDTPSADPAQLYADSLFAIAAERKINNGQPSFHAYLLRCAGLREGERVVHIGAGVGYYSAIMAELVGTSGAVTAIEFETDIAARARSNLKDRSNVKVIAGDGSTAEFDTADVIYVNAGATRPADIWLDRLRDGGRLVLPLTTNKGFDVDALGSARTHGGVFLITRQGAKFNAQCISAVAIYPCAGMRNEESERALARAFETGDVSRVTRLYRGDDVSAERCWLKAPGWCLAYE